MIGIIINTVLIISFVIVLLWFLVGDEDYVSVAGFFSLVFIVALVVKLGIFIAPKHIPNTLMCNDKIERKCLKEETGGYPVFGMNGTSTWVSTVTCSEYSQDFSIERGK